MAGTGQNLVQQFGETGGQAKYIKKATDLQVKDKRRHSDQTTSNQQEYKDEDYECSYIKQEQCGWWHWKRYGPTGKEHEEQHRLGQHNVRYADGSQSVMRSGNVSETNKQGTTTSNMGHHDNQDAKGHSRTNIGTQGGTGGSHTSCAGNQCDMTAGLKTVAQSQNQGGYGTGKLALNYEGGIGMGVNKGSSRKIYQRMEPDGTYHLQVTPSGSEGGKMVMKVTPDGNITVTSEQAMTIQTKTGITMETPAGITMKASGVHIDAPVTTTSSISSDGAHIAHGHV